MGFVTGGDIAELVDSLFPSLSDRLFRFRIEFKEESVNGSVECSESDRDRGCFREDRSSKDVESFVVINGGSVDIKYEP